MAAESEPQASPEVTIAVSDTGPLISAFQAESLPLLRRLFGEIHIPPACLTEIQNHGWQAEFDQARPYLVVVELTAAERRQAAAIAQQIAGEPGSVAENETLHAGEAEAIVLASRPAYADHVLLLDELAARRVAQAMGLNVSGFPGALLLSVQLDFISPEALKTQLETCRQQGTHYGEAFIERVYELAQKG